MILTPKMEASIYLLLLNTKFRDLIRDIEPEHSLYWIIILHPSSGSMDKVDCPMSVTLFISTMKKKINDLIKTMVITDLNWRLMDSYQIFKISSLKLHLAEYSPAKRLLLELTTK